MTKEEIIEAISEDKMMPFIQPEQLSGIVDFVIKNYHPGLPSNLDEAADCYKDTVTPEEVDDSEHAYSYETYTEYQIADAFKAGAEWIAGQFQKIEGELVDWYETKGVDYCCGIKTEDAFGVPKGFYIRKK